MDYLFFSVLKDTPIKHFNISYNIICQWSQHLWEHMEMLPNPIHFPYREKGITCFVPKFHLLDHIADYQWKYSFNFIKGVGWTDGKAPEYGWSTLNAAASSTKEMWTGKSTLVLVSKLWALSYNGLINHHTGKSILSKLKEVVPKWNEHQKDLHEFEASLSNVQYKEQLAQWKEDIEAWEDNMSRPNPFKVKSNGMYIISQCHIILSIPFFTIWHLSKSSLALESI